MTRSLRSTVYALAAAGLLAGAGSVAAQSAPSTAPDPKMSCMDMMQGSGLTEDGKKAMRDFMQSDRAPQAMANMMEMARKMGDGDVMLGMTKMMDMMGSMGSGGMMGGHGGGQTPGTTTPHSHGK